MAVSIALILAYLLGSFPFSIWTGRIFFSTDIREHGSRNAGATNAWRVLGWKAGLPVLVLDTAKGFVSVLLPLWILSGDTEPLALLWVQTACGAGAAMGHVFPVFAGFRGGKGVATLLGIVLGLMPLAALGSLAVFLAVFLVSRYVSLGSVTAALSFPVFIAIAGGPGLTPLHYFAGIIAIGVLITHRKNMIRLIRREESRVILFRKKH